jgi:hypothetical protein
MMAPQGAFTFRSSYTLPQDPDITLSNLDLSDGTRAQNDASVASHAPNPPITVTRPRTNTRYSTHPGRPNARTGNPPSRGPEKKRKMDMSDFFDISNSCFGKDGFGGGGKRGRFI